MDRVGVTNLARQAVMVESNTQPSCGKRAQLIPEIPEGLNDPLPYLARAMQLAHPFSDQSTLKEDHREVLASAK